MSRPRRAPTPEWPKTFCTPTHDLSVEQGADGWYYVRLLDSFDDSGPHSAYLTRAADPDVALQTAAGILMDASLTLRRVLRRMKQKAATSRAVTGNIDKNPGPSRY